MADALLVEVPLAGGLDETLDDALVPVDKARVCKNVVFPDAITAKKRQGLVQIGGSPLNIAKVLAHDSELLAVDGLSLFAYQGNSNMLVSRGPVSPCMVSRQLLAPPSGPTKTGAAFNVPIVPMGTVGEDSVTRLRVYAWSDGVNLQASVYDTVRQQYVQTATIIDDQSPHDQSGNPSCQPRIVIVNSVAFIIYWSQNATDIIYRAQDLTTLAGWHLGVTTLPIPGTTSVFDACVGISNTVGVIQTQVCMVVGNESTKTVKLACYSASGTTLSLLGSIQTVDTIAGSSPTFTTIGIAADLPTDTFGVVAIIYGWHQLPGGGGTEYVLDMAVWALVTNSSPTLETAPFAIQDNTVGTALSNTPLSFRGVGACRASLTGTPSTTLDWVVTWTADYQIHPTNISGAITIGTETRTVTSFYYAHVPDSGVGVQVYDPTIGYQTASKPFQYILNPKNLSGAVVPGVYCLAMFEDGVRTNYQQASITKAGTATTGAVVANQTYCLVQLRSDGLGFPWNQTKPCAVFAPRFGGDVVPVVSDVAILSGGNGVVIVGTEQDEANETSLTSVTMDFANVNLWQNVRLGTWTYLAGGLPCLYDGSSVYEAGFINPPPAPTVQLDANGYGGAGPLPIMQGLTYLLCYAQQDAQGNVHRSPPSNPILVDASGTHGKARLGIVPCKNTLRAVPVDNGSSTACANPIRIEIYRNNSLTPGVYQLLATILSDQTSPVITFDDTFADAANASAPILYTLGGGVPSDGPPSLSGLAVHADRIFGISEDGQTAYYTTELIRGEAPRFTDAFTLTWPNGPITAQWSLEQRLHAATASTIYYIFGDGPNDAGAGSDFTAPTLWKNNLGIVDARGVGLFYTGAILSTEKGLYMEDLAGNFTWLTQPRRTVLQYPTVTSITPIDADGTIRINLQSANGPSQGGATLHYDYRHQKWATHGLVSNSNIAILSSCVAGGTYFAVQSSVNSGVVSSAVLQESSSTNEDLGNYVATDIQSGWLLAGGETRQGYGRLHRFMILGQQQTPAQVSLQVARDYSATFDPAITWTDAEIAGLPSAPSFQLEETASPQKGEAFSFRVTDAAPATLSVGAGAGPIWKSLLIRYRMKRGENKNLSSTSRR